MMKRLATATFSAVVPLSLFVGSANANTDVAETPTAGQSRGICNQEINKSADQYKNPDKVDKLTGNERFRESASEIGSTPEELANDVSEYFTEEEVEQLIIDGLEDEGQQAQKKSKINTKIKPFDLDCGKARAGWALYQAQGFLVCAPATVVNPLAGAVCNIAKTAGGGAIDFNKLCD